MSRYYPVFLDLQGKPCLVIGDSWATEDKVKSLIEAGARVTLLAPAATGWLEAAAEKGAIDWIRRDYEPGDLSGFFLIIAARPDRTRNSEIAREARSRNITFNAVDDPANCGFIFPAIYRQGDLVIAVSSSGKSPAVAARLRDQFGQEVGPEYAELLEMLGSLRHEIAERYPDFGERRKIWYQLVDSPALERLRHSDREGAHTALREVLERA